MADITDLLEHAGDVRQPDLRELRRVVERRRRRTAALMTSIALGAVAALVLALPPPAGRDAVPAPIAPSPTSPSPTPTSSTPPDPGVTTPPPDTIRGPFPTLTPEEIRNHPDAAADFDDIPVTAAPGVAARLWSVCLADCSRATTYQNGELQRALEVTRDDFASSALYPYVPPEPNVSHVHDDWFAVTSIEDGFLVNSRGGQRPLTEGEDVPVNDIAGPLVYAPGGVSYVDLEDFTLHVLDGVGYWDWWGAGDTWFWGNVYLVDEAGRVLRQGLTWRNADGSFGVHMLPFGTTPASTHMLRSGTPGTMGAIEQGQPRLLHVSTDYGATWQVRVLPADWGRGTGVPDDWRSWVDDWPSWATP